MNKLIGTNFRIKENDVLFEAGKRLLENKNKNKTKLKPLITLITVVKNNDKFLEKTIKSVLNQSYKEIEYIIVDGGSKDDSLNIIKKYSDQIDYAVSQNDQGLWDAMNKGAHVYDLIKIHGMSYDDVAKAISIGKNTISQNVSAHEQTLLYHERYPEDEAWLQKFSHFLEIYKKRPLKDWIAVHDNMEQFMKWINKGQIPMAIQVRKLDKISSLKLGKIVIKNQCYIQLNICIKY